MRTYLLGSSAGSYDAPQLAGFRASLAFPAAAVPPNTSLEITSSFQAPVDAPVPANAQRRPQNTGTLNVYFYASILAHTMASADCPYPIAASLNAASLSAEHQPSRGNAPDFHSIHPSHLRISHPCDSGLQVSVPPRPCDTRLLCASCSSGRSFAYGFLPTLPCDCAVAVQLRVPVT